MKLQSSLKGILFSFCLIFFSTFSFSQNVNIPFTNPSSIPTSCGDTWVESGIQQQISAIPPNIGCSIYFGPSNIELAGVKLTLDLSPLSNITEITVSVFEYCQAGDIVVQFFDANSNLVGSIQSTQYGLHQISFTPTGIADISSMCVLGNCEGSIENILIVNDLCANNPNPQVLVENGDVYIEDVCYGVILTSPSGLCFRIRVDDSGNLISEPVVCP